MLNALTVDVEDYFQVNAFAKIISSDDWSSYPLRVGDNTKRVLDLFDEYQVKATFFVLGWVAERLPDLVKDIQRRGHEIASHGYGHELVYAIGPERFREDICRAKSILEDQIGARVYGYRAPSYSITINSLWAHDILIESGFTYDSSVFPVYHDTYGLPEASRFPYLVQSEHGEIVEFPMTTYPVRFAGMEYRLPIAGGGYLRLFPSELSCRCMEAINREENKPIVLYFHPWEIDPLQPRISAGFKSRFRHYLNLRSTERKLRQLISRIKFAPMNDVISGIKHELV